MEAISELREALIEAKLSQQTDPGHANFNKATAERREAHVRAAQAKLDPMAKGMARLPFATKGKHDNRLSFRKVAATYLGKLTDGEFCQYTQAAVIDKIKAGILTGQGSGHLYAGLKAAVVVADMHALIEGENQAGRLAAVMANILGEMLNECRAIERIARQDDKFRNKFGKNFWEKKQRLA